MCSGYAKFHQTLCVFSVSITLWVIKKETDSTWTVPSKWLVIDESVDRHGEVQFQSCRHDSNCHTASCWGCCKVDHSSRLFLSVPEHRKQTDRQMVRSCHTTSFAGRENYYISEEKSVKTCIIGTKRFLNGFTLLRCMYSVSSWAAFIAAHNALIALTLSTYKI